MDMGRQYDDLALKVLLERLKSEPKKKKMLSVHKRMRKYMGKKRG